MRLPLIVGNWKMNGLAAQASELTSAVVDGAAALGDIEIGVCPPFPYLEAVRSCLSNSRVLLGAQNVAAEREGAYTGEVSAPMLADCGCSLVICGHSERREYYGESDEVVARKVAVCVASGLTPILCVGETLDEREQGRMAEVIASQINGVMSRLGADIFARMAVAYEPVWAIGTGKTATPEQAQEVHALIRQCIAQDNAAVAEELRILYGGSMKPGNAAELLAQPDIDGGLIGGASLSARDFLAICQAAAQSTG